VDFTGPDGVKRQDIAALHASLVDKANVVRRVAHLAPIGPRDCLMEMENSEDGGPMPRARLPTSRWTSVARWFVSRRSC